MRRLSGNVLNQSSCQFTTSKHVTTTVQQHLTMLRMVDYSAATTDCAMRMLENQCTRHQLTVHKTPDNASHGGLQCSKH